MGFRVDNHGAALSDLVFDCLSEVSEGSHRVRYREGSEGRCESADEGDLQVVGMHYHVIQSGPGKAGLHQGIAGRLGMIAVKEDALSAVGFEQAFADYPAVKDQLRVEKCNGTPDTG